MRFPKTVQISGKQYSVKVDNTCWGGHCQTGKQEIKVGTARNQSLQRRFTTFFHEVAESVALERHLRYEAADEEVLFVMTHKQFADYVKDVATAIFPMMEKKKC